MIALEYTSHSRIMRLFFTPVSVLPDAVRSFYLLLPGGDTVARAHGMAQLAKDSGLGRENLYKALTPGAKSRYDTMMKVIRAIGVKLHAEAA